MPQELTEYVDITHNRRHCSGNTNVTSSPAPRVAALVNSWIRIPRILGKKEEGGGGNTPSARSSWYRQSNDTFGEINFVSSKSSRIEGRKNEDIR